MPACLRCSVLPASLLIVTSALNAAPARAQTSPPVEGFLSLNASMLRPTTTSVSLSTVVIDPPDRDEGRTAFHLGNQPGWDIGGGILCGAICSSAWQSPGSRIRSPEPSPTSHSTRRSIRR